MSSYVNIILDTIGPSGVSLTINNGETKTTTTAVSLSIACSDTDLTDYQMKIWGIAGAETEENAVWETYQATKTVTLPTRDGTKTVYVKVRDDVWNESAVASDTISLFTTIPTISEFGLTRTKLSLVDKKNVTNGGFSVDEHIDAIKIMLVDDINAPHNAPTNISIPTTNGSYIYDDTAADVYKTDVLEVESDSIDRIQRIFEFEIYAADILAASPGDGAKLIKAFVRSSTSGNWSV